MSSETKSRARELVAPIKDLIAYHEEYAKNHVSSQWIYGENMMVVKAYKKVLEMIDQLESSSSADTGGREATLTVEDVFNSHSFVGWEEQEQEGPHRGRNKGWAEWTRRLNEILAARSADTGTTGADGLRIGQVVALRGPDGEWEYDRIVEFVDDGSARLSIAPNRRKLETLRALTPEEQ